MEKDQIERDRIRAENEKKRKEAEEKSGLKVFQVSNPLVESKKVVKPLIQKPKPQLDSKCSHDRRIIFNPKCQIFYRDQDLVIEGVENLEDNEGRVEFSEDGSNNSNKQIVINKTLNLNEK